MPDQRKYLRAALENIKKVARQKSAERLMRKMEAKKPAPPKPPEPSKEASDNAADELELELTKKPEPEAEEPAEKTTTLVVIGAPRRGVKSTPNGVKDMPSVEKRKPGRPRRVT